MLKTDWTIKEKFDLADGRVLINRSQDVQSLIDINKHEAEVNPSMFGAARVRKIGSIPMVVAETWARECGASVGSKEFAEYAKKKLMSGEWNAFKIKDA